jgi:hypothetical protein
MELFAQMLAAFRRVQNFFCAKAGGRPFYENH